jgi:hypothetical protein
MITPVQDQQDVHSTGDDPVEALYRQLLAAWNKRSAIEYATCFAIESNVIGFDGSQMNGQVRYLTLDVVLLRAVVGMVPPGKTALNPAVNAIQTLVAQRNGGQWRATLLQNTPAQFHGRPELAEALTEELRQLL